MAKRRARHKDDADGEPLTPAGTAASKRRNGGRPANLGVLKDRLGYFLRRVQVWVFQDFIRSLASVDIRPAQYAVLVMIGANRGLSQADVAELLGIERARLVRLLDRLENRGLVQRLPSPVDRRSHVLKLTPAGQTMLKRANSLAALHEARLAARLGPAQHKMMLEALNEFDHSR
jgi:DNA-binding MarR family transcriptional regulator